MTWRVGSAAGSAAGSAGEVVSIDCPEFIDHNYIARVRALSFPETDRQLSQTTSFTIFSSYQIARCDQWRGGRLDLV